MKKVLFFLFSVFMLSYTQAGAAQWEIDPIHTGFFFDIKHIYSTVRGQFDVFSGDIFFDPDTPGKNRIYLEVQVDSINTNNSKRDIHLRSDEFFDAGKYPVMTFESSKITPATGNKYTAEGKLTIKNKSRDAQLEFFYWGEKVHALMKGKIVAGLETRTKINRLDYGVGTGKFAQMGVVGQDVDILITLEMIRNQ